MLTYENAGHTPGLLMRASGGVDSLAGGGAVLGALPDWVYQDHTVQLGHGDKLVLSTDGITEAENTQLEEFGEQRLIEVALARELSALDTQRAIMQRVTAFCAGDFRDDATLLVLRIA
jgi:sigma-B regulation protein RsbU (phosphoserine phosphatase)